MKRRGRGGSFPENEDLPGNGLLQSGPRGKVQEKDVHVEAKKLTYWLVYGGKISIIVIPLLKKGGPHSKWERANQILGGLMNTYQTSSEVAKIFRTLKVTNMIGRLTASTVEIKLSGAKPHSNAL